MQKYIAILRGINVSGQKTIKMESLKAHMAACGFKNITTYIQSGNLIFESEEISDTEIAKKIESQILKEYGFEVPVIVRTPEELQTILTHNPFLNQRKEDIDKLHVTFLSEPSEKQYLDKIKQPENTLDEFVIAGNCVYIFCANGYGKTKINNTFFENKLKVTATTRNWKTVMKLAEMAQTVSK
jgi:uncharacterized protein (DUF1697 family)